MFFVPVKVLPFVDKLKMIRIILVKTICDLLKWGSHFNPMLKWLQRSAALTLFLKTAISVSLSHLLFRIGKDFEDDLEFLLQGVSDFDLRGGLIASEVLVHGPLAFPIGTAANGRAFLAGAYYGQGRVVVISHEGLLQREVGSKLLICLKKQYMSNCRLIWSVFQLLPFL